MAYGKKTSGTTGDPMMGSRMRSKYDRSGMKSALMAAAGGNGKKRKKTNSKMSSKSYT